MSPQIIKFIVLEYNWVKTDSRRSKKVEKLPAGGL
jgi:hypothetical protein